MKIIILRHGQTVDNVKRLLQGQSNSELTDLGIKQAEKVADRLKTEGVHHIYTSDLKRCIDTAEQIAKYYPVIEVIWDKRLRERDFAEFTGYAYDNGWNWDNMPESVESDEELHKRASEFLSEIYKKHKNETVLLVTHSGTKRALLSVLHEKSHEHLSEWGLCKNTGVTVIEIDEKGKRTMDVLHCVKHLED